MPEKDKKKSPPSPPPPPPTRSVKGGMDKPKPQSNDKKRK